MIEAQVAHAQDFASASGFSYNASLAEFAGGLLRQKDQRPTNSIVGATYTSSKNLNWSQGGSLVATDIGSPVLAAGKLACLGGLNNAVRYENAEIGAVGDTGAIKLKYTPAYTGTPGDNYTIAELGPTSGNNGRLLFLHSVSGGTIRVTAYNSAGVAVHTAAVMGAAWSPVAGTEYELEFNWDVTTGLIRWFVNGVLGGSAATTTFNRGTTATRLIVGAGTVYTRTDASFNDVLLFTEVQHTAGYTPGYSVSELSYLESNAALPEMPKAEPGTFLSATSFSATDSNAPRYTVQIGQSGTYLYWNGSAWVASDGSYAQANPASVLNANAPALDVEGELYIQIRAHFESSNVLQSVDSLSLSILETVGYSTDAQRVKAIERFTAGELTSFIEAASAPVGAHVRYILEIDSSQFYWNGTSFSRSNGSFAQANTAEELHDNILKAMDREHYVRLIALLKTDDNSETPELTSSTFEYDADPHGARGFLDSVLAFIGAPSLTDEEYEGLELEDSDWNAETYTALLGVLEERDSVSDSTDRLEHVFLARGVEISESANDQPKSNILIGGGL